MRKLNIKVDAMGLTSAVLWGLDTILIALVLGSGVFTKNENSIILAPLISTFLHHSFSTLWTGLYLIITKKTKGFIKAFQSKSGAYVILGALLGGPIGMTGYILAIKYLGPSYAAIISTIYPAVAAILGCIILKKKLSKKVSLGLAVISVSIILLIVTTIGIKDNYHGLFYILLCIGGWGAEKIISVYGVKEKEVTIEQSLTIRQLISSMVYGIIIIPIIQGVSLLGEVIVDKSFVIFIIVALLGTISSFCILYTKKQMGTAKAIGLNITYAVWTILLDIIVLGNEISLKTIILSILIIGGSYMVVKGTEQ